MRKSVKWVCELEINILLDVSHVENWWDVEGNETTANDGVDVDLTSRAGDLDGLVSKSLGEAKQVGSNEGSLTGCRRNRVCQ